MALASAALFGASSPLAKRLLPSSGPVLLAGLLYLGAGLGLLLAKALARGAAASTESALRRSDLPLLAGTTFVGGVLGPVLMLAGLARLPGVTSALLLNLEAPLTILIAVGLFCEHLSRREGGAALVIVIGAASLTHWRGESAQDLWGVAALVGACASWALDNNLSQRLSLRDPVSVVAFKALGAAAFSLTVATLTRQALPSPSLLGAALLLGSLSYGLSLVLNVRALRAMGAARVAAFFATAPFMGALLAVPLLGESLSEADALSASVMALGVMALVRARHGHRHAHSLQEHDHQHVHDEHHQHVHAGPVTEPHAHWHVHQALVHDHPHLSDAHHRHEHGKA